MSSFGVRLAIERKKIDLSQAALAKLGGVRANAQAHYESGKRTPRADYLAAISAAGVDVNYVVTGQKKGGVSGDLAQAILSELHNRLWYTAQAIGELALLLDPADKRTPRDHIAEYLKFLNRNN